jgi:hypothetical protein
MQQVKILSPGEMKKLTAACNRLFRIESGTRISTSYWEDGCTYNGKIVGISSTNLKIEFDDGEIHTLPRKYIRVGNDYRERDFIDILMTTALDFRMNVSVVGKAVEHFRQRYPFRSTTIGTLATVMKRYPNSRVGNTELAQELWGNRHWSRAKFLRTLVERFSSEGVTNYRGLVKWLKKHDFDKDVKGKFKTKEHSIGLVIFKWLCLRSGLPAVKADVHVLKFVKQAIGRRPSPRVATSSLDTIAVILKRPHHELDSSIWHTMRDGRAKR